ncbi:hypothetical protein DBR22_15405 [Arthrobacter sp. HMWF013]|nr:hypothetical protein DBR22_15405 [Arthrobacter sp. HMWF013]
MVPSCTKVRRTQYGELADAFELHPPVFVKPIRSLLVMCCTRTTYQPRHGIREWLSAGRNSGQNLAARIDDDVTPFKERVAAEAAEKHGSGAEVASLTLAAVPPGLDMSGDKQARWQLPSADRAWSYQASLEEVFPQGSLLFANSAQRLAVSLFISPIVLRTTKQTIVGDGQCYVQGAE